MPIFNLDVFSEFPRCCEHYGFDEYQRLLE